MSFRFKKKPDKPKRKKCKDEISLYDFNNIQDIKDKADSLNIELKNVTIQEDEDKDGDDIVVVFTYNEPDDQYNKRLQGKGKDKGQAA